MNTYIFTSKNSSAILTISDETQEGAETQANNTLIPNHDFYLSEALAEDGSEIDIAE